MFLHPQCNVQKYIRCTYKSDAFINLMAVGRASPRAQAAEKSGVTRTFAPPATTIPSAQKLHRSRCHVDQGVWEYAEVQHAGDAAVDGDTDRPGESNGGQIRWVAGPVNGTGDTEVEKGRG